MTTSPIGKIKAIKTAFGFIVYGRLGAVMRADQDKEITYCNLNSDAAEYARMQNRLAACE